MPKTKSFVKLERAVKAEYLGKKIPAKFKKKYGHKKYTLKDVKGIGYAVAKSHKIRIH